MGGRKCSLRGKVRCQDVGLKHDETDVFVLPIYIPARLYTGWLASWALYFCLALSLDGLYYREWFREREHAWIVYLDNWGYILLVCSVTTDCVLNVFTKLCRPELVLGLCDELPWYLKIGWVLFNTNNCVALFVTSLFLATETLEFDHSSVNKHIFNSGFVLTNLFLSAKPVRLHHVYQPMAFVMSYAIFTVIYQELGKKPFIYSYLDWSTSKNSVVACSVAVFAVTPGIQLILFSLVKCRDLLFRKSFLTTKFGQCRSATPMQRDLTATDVVLVEPRSRVQELVIPPDSKDDITVHLHKGNREEREYLDQVKTRLYRSESDLQDYMNKNGLNCVSFDAELGLTRKDPIRHSRIIVVKTFAASSTDDDLSISRKSFSSGTSIDSSDSVGKQSHREDFEVHPHKREDHTTDLGVLL